MSHTTATATHGADAHGEHHGGMGHVMPLPILFGVFVALIFFTGLTLLLAGNVPGPLELPVAMTIATVKGALVVLYFMHVRYDKLFNAFAFLSSFVFVALFIVFSLTDTEQNDASKREYELLNPVPAVANP